MIDITTKIYPETIGTVAGQISVELSTRFLQHFSEQLYSSPQKAFEELISNGWDAGADCVDVRISSNLADPYVAIQYGLVCYNKGRLPESPANSRRTVILDSGEMQADENP